MQENNDKTDNKSKFCPRSIPETLDMTKVDIEQDTLSQKSISSVNH